MAKYCEICGKNVETKIITKSETYPVLGEKIEVEAKVLICKECGEEFFCEEFDTETLNKAYNIYRKCHKLLFPEEIKGIREQYGLSQRGFAKLLNWGDKTIFRYENGSIQDKAHNDILFLLKDPFNMKNYILKNESNINEKQKNKILNLIKELEKETIVSSNKWLYNYINQQPSIENGYKLFDYKKFCAMVLFFVHKTKCLLKVKLLKLLNYSDMIYFKEKGTSISGLIYIHQKFGPVPLNYEFLFGMLAADHVIHTDITFENGYEKHQIVSDAEFPKDVLNHDELKVLDKINKRFKNFGSVEISNYSHNERGYMKTKQGDIISYEYAKDINF